MFKLLPKEIEKQVVREYTSRRFTMILMGLSTVLFIGVVGLAPSYILARSRKAQITERARLLDIAGIKGDENGLSKWLDDTNKRLAALDPKLDTDKPSEDMEKAVTPKDKNIKLLELNWQKDSKNNVTLTITGLATTRQALIDYEKRLETSGNFSSVVLPVSNLARDKDLDFEMKLTPLKP